MRHILPLLRRPRWASGGLGWLVKGTAGVLLPCAAPGANAPERPARDRAAGAALQWVGRCNTPTRCLCGCAAQRSVRPGAAFRPAAPKFRPFRATPWSADWPRLPASRSEARRAPSEAWGDGPEQANKGTVTEAMVPLRTLGIPTSSTTAVHRRAGCTDGGTQTCRSRRWSTDSAARSPQPAGRSADAQMRNTGSDGEGRWSISGTEPISISLVLPGVAGLLPPRRVL